MLIQRIRKIGRFVLQIPRQRQKFLLLFGVVFVLGIGLLPFYEAHAQDPILNAVTTALGWIASVIFSLLGRLLTAIIDMLIKVAQYNRIIDQGTVQSTWVLIKDFVNMFFVFGLLLIAFSTILHFQDYEAKRRLPRFVFYAVLVNFSLTICGLFIDIAQVIMLTFVNAFKDSAITNFTSLTGLLDYGTLELSTGTVTTGEVLAGYIMGIAFMVLSIAAIGAMLVMLLVRILFLWILVILSPFAFVLPAIPRAERYAAQWWEMFSKYVITGPLLAFFIWLALTVAGTDINIGNEIVGNSGVSIVRTKTGSSGFFINFLIGIGMMYAGLLLTSRIGGAAGSAAGIVAGGAKGAALGRLGPTPMRWARERWESYRGARQSVRREQAQRFGQGASALQDRAITGRLQQAAGAPTGAAIRGSSRLANRMWQGIGGSAEGRVGRLLQRGEGAAPGQLGRRRAVERASDYTERQTAANLQTQAKAQDLANQRDPNALRARYQQERSQTARAAIADELNRRGELGRNPADQAMIRETQAFLRQAPAAFKKFDDTQRSNFSKHLTELSDQTLRAQFRTATEEWQRAAIGQRLNDMGSLGRETGDDQIELATRQYLERETPDTLEKFNDAMKRNNAQFAFDKVYRNRETNDIDVDRVISDLNTGKLRASSLTQNMVQVLDAQLSDRTDLRKGAFGEQWVKSLVDPKEIKDKLKGMENVVLDSMSNGMNIFAQSLDRRMAFGEASGNWHQVFDIDNADTHTAANAENDFRTFMSYGKSRKMFYEDGSEATLKNKNFWEAIHSNKQYSPSESQLKTMTDDPRRKKALDEANRSIVNDANTFNFQTHNQDYSDAAVRARELQVKLMGGNTLKDAKGDPVIGANGEPVQIFNINGPDQANAIQAREKLKNAVRSNKIKAEDFKKDKAPDHLDDYLYEILSSYSDEQMSRLAEENKTLVEKWIAHLDANKSDANNYKDRLKRLKRNRMFSNFDIPSQEDQENP